MLRLEVMKMLAGMFPYTYNNYPHVVSGGSWWVPVLIIAVTLAAFALYAWRTWRSARHGTVAHDVTPVPKAEGGRKAA
jgi:hypothetical protein